MSLPICLGAAHRASAFDVELPAFECQKYSEHKQAALDLFTPELDHGGSSIVNACAAWAILVASHENTTTLRISSPRISDGSKYLLSIVELALYSQTMCHAAYPILSLRRQMLTSRISRGLQRPTCIVELSYQ